MDDDDICINLSTSVNPVKIKPKRVVPKVVSRASVPTVSAGTSRGSAVELHTRPKPKATSHVSSSNKIDKVGLERKRRRDDDADVTHQRKRPRFSSLFSNNPDIPQVKCMEVKPVKEPIFTVKKFSSLSLHPFTVSNLSKLGIETMTSVQQAAIPAIFDSRDVLIRSQTGSGKTLSYVIPVVEMLQSHMPKVQRSDGPYCIVVVPTRELAIQTLDVFQKIVKPFLYIVPGSIMGGEKKKSEKARLRRGVNILVATPGRLVDHIKNTKCLQLERIKYLIIDEADRLLDLGFEKDVSTVITSIREAVSGHQTILLSATLSSGVERLAGMSLLNPVRLEITNPSSSNSKACEFSTPESLHHYFITVPSKLRLVTLAAFLLDKCKLSKSACKIIVFLSTQDAVEFHYQLLQTSLCNGEEDADHEMDSSQFKLNLYKLHGDMQQKERSDVFHKFHSVRGGVLLCTDVASRGLDLPSVEWIVQYNTPGKPTDYIHRVGRTARLGVAGNAVLFLTPSEVEYVDVMSNHGIGMKEMKMDDLLKALFVLGENSRFLHKGEQARSVHDFAAFLQAKFERHVTESKELSALARKAYQSFIRAYATYTADMKKIFHVKNLHLGHVAKSFALAEAPSQIAEILGKHVAGPAFGDRHKGHKVPSMKRDKMSSQRLGVILPPRKFKEPDLMSEFASGL